VLVRPVAALAPHDAEQEVLAVLLEPGAAEGQELGRDALALGHGHHVAVLDQGAVLLEHAIASLVVQQLEDLDVIAAVGDPVHAALWVKPEHDHFLEQKANNISRFSSLYFNLLLVPFLLSSSLGAGSGKRTRKPLRAHQERILVAMKENTAVFLLQTKLRFLYWKFNIVRSLYINASFHHLRRITPIIH
jgi:hypothetical protein